MTGIELKATCRVPEDTDLSAMLIFDRGVPRADLGLRVRTMAFDDISRTSRVAPAILVTSKATTRRKRQSRAPQGHRPGRRGCSK